MFGFGKKIHRSVMDAQTVEVSEVDGIRSLYLGSNTIQSSMRVKTPTELVLSYSRGMMMFLMFTNDVKEVLMIGLGGGSIPKFIHRHLPKIHTRVLDINPQVISIARSHFYLPENDERLDVIEGDGEEYIRAHPATTQVLMLDIFDGQGIPANLYSQDFFDHCAEALKSDGIMTVNLWGSDKNLPLYMQRVEIAFNRLMLMLPTGKPGNIVLIAFKKAPCELRWEALQSRAESLDTLYDLNFTDLLERLFDNNQSNKKQLFLEAF